VKLKFRKMNGAGNDFVMIDNRMGELSLEPGQIADICDRRRGVGADGLISLVAHDQLDFFMDFYNSDGGREVMCGNGARCTAAFGAWVLGRSEGDGATRVRFGTGSGPIDASVGENSVSVSMMDAADMFLDVPVEVASLPGRVHFMVVGTRHAVVQMDSVTSLTHDDIMGLGSALRHDPAFAPQGANVNFSSVGDDGNIHLRTYEKGVEAETHACGTGSIAAAVLYAHTSGGGDERTVVQRSGDVLQVTFTRAPHGATGVVMEGPVAVNFEGEIEI